MKIIKSLAYGALAAVTVALLFQTPTTRADDRGQKGDDNERGNHGQRIDDRFVILLEGIYQPVPLGQGPRHNLGLTSVNLGDGSFSKVKIHPITGIPGNQKKPIGTFYVQFGGMYCAYDLPGGSFVAKFTGIHDVVTSYEESADGSWTLDGTFELNILEATGIYQPFAGGHIHMVDILKFRAGDSTFLEDCFCHIHPKLVAP